MKIKGPLASVMMLLPVVILVLGGFLVFKQYNRLKALRLEEKDIRQDINTIQQNLIALKSLNDFDKFAATPRSEAEQAGFIDMLQLIARETGVKIESFRSLPSPPAPKPKEGEKARVIKYQPSPTSITVLGGFDESRNFAYSLMRTNRLLNTSQIRWERDRENRFTKLTFVVTRYVKDATPEEIAESIKEAAKKPKPEIMGAK